MHCTLQPARALIARRIMISFFLVSKQSGGQAACPPGAEPPCHGPTSTGHREGNKGAIFTLVIALNWWLAGYNR